LDILSILGQSKNSSLDQVKKVSEKDVLGQAKKVLKKDILGQAKKVSEGRK